MDLREFMRFHLLKALLAFVTLQIIVIAIIQNYNHPPVAMPDTITVVEQQTVKISPLINDTDKDAGNELLIAQFTNPFNGSIKQKGNFLFYTPNNGFTGPDSLTYIITDGKKNSRKAIITISVTPNLAPVANADSVKVYCNNTTIIDVLNNDTDNENDSIYIAHFTQPINGKIILYKNQFLYTANCPQNLTDSFTYIVNDNKNKSNVATVKINIKPNTEPCYPWLPTDIGHTAIAGSLSFLNNSLVLTASGNDIWDNSDDFLYASQLTSGNFVIYTKIDSFTAINEWAKAGIMLRGSLMANATNVFICLTGKHGIGFQYRSNPGQQTQGSKNIDLNAPCWVKIERNNNTFGFFTSANGIKWDNIGTQQVDMEPNVFVGLAVTSHNNSETATAKFSNYKLKKQ